MAGRVRIPFTKQRQSRFLSVLAETCNVRHACAAVRVSATVVYDRRREDDAFAARWQDALTQGYHRLEEALLCHALASVANASKAAAGGDRAGDGGKGGDGGEGGVGGDAPAPPAPPAGKGHRQPGSGIADTLTPAAVQLALLLLNRHRATVEGKGKPMMSDRRRATADETDAALARKLDVLARRLRIEGTA